MTPRRHPKLLRYTEELHGNRPWGSVLDAGTGVQSLQWIADLPTENWTAISASPHHAELTRKAIGQRQRPQDKLIIGNWVDGDLLKGESFDTVIADYLLGAVEGFAPYFQPYLFQRLRPLTKQTLYVKGLEPYVPTERPSSKPGQLVWDIGRHRDACVLLSGDVPYREYPALWVVDQLRIAGFRVTEVKHFSIKYKSKFVNAQIDLTKPGLMKMADRDLAAALINRGEALRRLALQTVEQEGSLAFGRNYVIAAEPV